MWIPRLVTACGALLAASAAFAEPRLIAIAVDGRPHATVVRLTIEEGPVHPGLHMLRDHRLVLDLPGVLPALRRHVIDGETKQLRQIRVGIHEEPETRTRVVFDLEGPTEFEVRPSAAGLEVLLRAPESPPFPPSPRPTPADIGAPEATSTASPTSTVSPTPTPNPSPTPTPTPSPTPGPSAAPSPTLTRIPQPDPSRAPVDKATPEPQRAAGDSVPLPSSVEAETPRMEAGVEPVPAGLVTIDFRDADIRTVIDLVANVGGYDVIFTPEVRGVLTVRIVDRPWEEALQTILDQKDLRATRHADLILVSTEEWDN